MTPESKKALEEFERWSKEVKRGAASLAILAVLDEQEARRLGVREFLLKPFTRADLAEAIRRVIDDPKSQP